MSQNYEPEFKKRIIRLHLEEGRSLKSLAEEYHISKSAISIWCKTFREECQNNTSQNSNNKSELELMQENLKLRKELDEMKKENLFLKKAAAFFAKEIE